MWNVLNYVDLCLIEFYVLDLENLFVDFLGVEGDLFFVLFSEVVVYGVLWDLVSMFVFLYFVEDVFKEVVGFIYELNVGVIGVDFFDFFNDWCCIYSSFEDEIVFQVFLEIYGYLLNFDEELFCLLDYMN